MPLRRELIDPGFSHRYECELSGDEESVGKHQGEDREQAQHEVGRIEHQALLGPTLADAGTKRQPVGDGSDRAYARRLLKKCASTNSSMAA